MGPALRIAISVALVALLAWQLDLSAMWEQLVQIPLGSALAICVVLFFQVCVSVIRWRRVLHYLGHAQDFRALMADMLVGRALNLVLPTQVGGDVARAVRSSRRVGPGDAWAAVLYERLFGMLVLALFPALGLPFLRAEVPLGVGGSVLGSILVLVLVLGFADRALGLASVWTARLPTLSETLKSLRDAFRGGLSSRSARFETAFWSVLNHGLNFTMLILAALSWDQPGLVGAVLIGVPLALIAAMLPISFGGHGLRESLFVVMLGLLGVSSERALALSVVWLALLVPPAVAGLAVLAFERSRAPEA